MTGIQWTDETWNPSRGCSRVSEGCRNCYAERVAVRFSGPGKPYEGFAQVVAPRDHMDRVGGRRNGWTKRVELIPEMLAKPLHWRKPRRVFVNSMSDLGHERLGYDDFVAVLGVIAACPQHTFQVLTKRPAKVLEHFERVVLETVGRFTRPALIEHAASVLREWAVGTEDAEERDRRHRNADRLFLEANLKAGMHAWPLPNVHLGVSCENQETADERIPLLLQTPAALRFVSLEPLLGPVDLQRHHWTATYAQWLDWVIVGGESGPRARPCDVAWIRSIRDQCKAAGVPCFVKQLGARPVIYDTEHEWFDGVDFHKGGRRIWKPTHSKGGDPAEWPEDLRVREHPA